MHCSKYLCRNHQYSIVSLCVFHRNLCLIDILLLTSNFLPFFKSGSNLLNTHFLTNNAQQLLQTIQPPNILPTLAAAAAAQHHQQSQQVAAAAAAAAAAASREQSSKSSGGSGSSGSGNSSNLRDTVNHHDRKMHSHHQSSRHSPLVSSRENRSSSHGAGGNSGSTGGGNSGSGNSERNSSRIHQERPKSHSPQPTNLSNSFLYDKMRETNEGGSGGRGSSGGAARLTPIPERQSDEREEHRKGSPVNRESNSRSPSFPSR